ncbi:MAG: hypothetical protein H7311_06455 [Ramlibacter sp.]|nr:hypothetical protein [Cryobacterium sp.]
MSLRPRRSPSGNTRLSLFGLTVAATLTALLVSVTVTGGASAYYTAPGSGSGSAALGTLSPPTAVQVPATSDGTVHVSWTASAGLAPTGYYATRTATGAGATAAPARGTSPTVTVKTLSCDDVAVATGSYTYTVTAVYGGWTAASAPSGSVTVSTPTQLAFQSQPSSSASGAIFTTQPSVVIQNSSGGTTTTSTSPVTLSITGSPVGATLTCTQNPRPAVSGIAAFSGCQIDKAGTYQLTATSAGLTAALSNSFVISASTAARLALTTEPTDSTGGVAFPGQPVVTVLDAFGNAVTTSNAPVNLSFTTPNGATLTCITNPLPAASGVAKSTGCKIDKAGTYTLTATSGSLTSATSRSVIVSVGSAAKLSFTQPAVNFSIVSQTVFASENQAKVTVQDAGGNTVTGSTATVSLSLTTPARATLACASNSLAATSGIAAFSGCKIDKVGTYTLTPTSGLLTATTSAAKITITAGTAAQLFFTQPTANFSAISQTAFASGSQPIVTVQDLSGNTITGSTATVALSLTAPGGATLACSSNSLAASSGIAGFSACKIDKAGAYTLNASSGSLSSATSTATVTITAGIATQLAFTAQPPATGSTTKSSFNTTITARDAAGNGAIAAVTLSVTGNPQGTNVTCTINPVTSNVSGQADFGCKINKAGTFTLTAT